MSTRLHSTLSARLHVLFAILATFTLVTTGARSLSHTAAAERQSGNTTLYLPLIMNANDGTSPPPPPPLESGAVILNRDVPLRSADIAVDAQGGMHFAYTAVQNDANNNRPVYYAHCPATTGMSCAEATNWRVVALSNDMPFVQLELDPRGRPRLLLHNDSLYFDNLPGTLYQYAECNTNCTSADSWTVVELGASRDGGAMYSTDYSSHIFALDHLGRPRFVYEDYNREAGQSTSRWYVVCDDDCGTASNWSETQLPDANFNLERASLRFTRDGRPRLLADASGNPFNNVPDMLVYLECNTGCHDGSNWSAPTQLFALGSGPGHYSWSLQLDGNDRPRATFYPRGGPLAYAWCNDDCSDSSNWQGRQIGLEALDGQHPALALDGLGRPRIAYKDHTGTGLGYIYCNVNCETMDAEWHGGLVEDSNVLNQEYHIPPPPECVKATWIGGYRPALALDKAGHPRIAYDGEYLQECKVDPHNPSDPRTKTETKWWTSRLVFFQQPQ